MKTTIFVAMLAFFSTVCLADDESDIVTGCLMSNAVDKRETKGETKGQKDKRGRYPFSHLEE